MDSGFHFWLMELGFWIQIVNRIPEFRTPEEKKFPYSGMRIPLHGEKCMRGNRGFLLEVQSHAGMFSPLAANPT